MPPITTHQSSETTKLLFIGESGSGKTGALASLAAAGYNLRILDYDNGLDILRDLVTNAKSQYLAKNREVAGNIHYVTLTEKMRVLDGKVFPAAATVWPRTINMLSDWKDGELSLGPVANWGPKDVLVIDTLTALAMGAYYYILSLNGQLMNQPTGYDYQRKIGLAQALVDDLLHMLGAAEIKCNVIVSSHVLYTDEPGVVRENQEQKIPQQGFPTSLGRALSPRIPRVFNTVLMAKKTGFVQRIYVKTATNVNLKSSAPLKVANDYPLETGLADYFAAIRS